MRVALRTDLGSSGWSVCATLAGWVGLPSGGEQGTLSVNFAIPVLRALGRRLAPSYLCGRSVSGDSKHTGLPGGLRGFSARTRAKCLARPRQVASAQEDKAHQPPSDPLALGDRSVHPQKRPQGGAAPARIPPFHRLLAAPRQVGTLFLARHHRYRNHSTGRAGVGRVGQESWREGTQQPASCPLPPAHSEADTSAAGAPDCPVSPSLRPPRCLPHPGMAVAAAGQR